MIDSIKNKMVRTVCYHLYEVKGQKELIYEDRNQNSGCLWSEEG